MLSCVVFLFRLSRISHSEPRFPAPSSKLHYLVTPLQGHSLFLRSCPPTLSAPSERFWYWLHSEYRFPASSSKLPYLVTPPKGQSLFPSAPSERFGYWYVCGSSPAPKHPRKHETHPPRVKEKKRVPSRFKRLWFYLCWCKLRWRL